MILISIRLRCALYCRWVYLAEHGDVLIELVLLQILDLFFIKEAPINRLPLKHFTCHVDISALSLGGGAFKDAFRILSVLKDSVA